MRITKRFFNRDHWKNPEFQSAMVRLGIWFVAFLHVSISQLLGNLSIDNDYYLWAFGITLLLFLGVLISVLIRPVWPKRQFFTLLIDIGAVTSAFWPTEQAIDPFCLFYVWIGVSYGARYGKRHQFYAAVGSAIAYTGVVVANDLFIRQPTETLFFLIFLLLLPLYQHMIISARIYAEQATEVKNRFLSTMTHELRTPLSGVIGMARLLDGTQLDREQREYVDSIQTASDVLMSLIGDILDFSKIEAERLEVDRSNFDIQECVAVICRSLSSRAEEKKLELICNIDADVPYEISSDETRVKQILYNLIGNAIKFTERGEVKVSVSKITARSSLTPQLQIQIQDTGPGIESDKLERIFDGFWQENLTVTRTHGGTGLGTTISRELAQLLGGDVSVTSILGVGSTFRVFLPLDEECSVAPLSDPKRFAGKVFQLIEKNHSSYGVISDILMRQGAELVSNVDRGRQDNRRVDLLILADNFTGISLNTMAKCHAVSLLEDTPVLLLGYASRPAAHEIPRSIFMPKPVVPRQLCEMIERILYGADSCSVLENKADAFLPQAGRSPVRILLAEDEPINAKLMSALLRKRGHEVSLVDNGATALERLCQERFDLAFLDVRMPEMSGIEVTRRLRELENDGRRRLPVLALTASAMNDTKEACLSAGMDEFLLKPISPKRLDELIERYTSPYFSRGPSNLHEWQQSVI